MDEDDTLPVAYVPSAHEVVPTAVPIPPLPDPSSLPPDPLEFVGEIANILQGSVIVRGGVVKPETVPLQKRLDAALDEGSLLLLEDRTMLGHVWETFGPTSLPHYVVRIQDSNLTGLKVSAPIYHIPSISNFVFPSDLARLKGSDASNVHDEEVSEDELELSDEEAVEDELGINDHDEVENDSNMWFHDSGTGPTTSKNIRPSSPTQFAVPPHPTDHPDHRMLRTYESQQPQYGPGYHNPTYESQQPQYGPGYHNPTYESQQPQYGPGHNPAYNYFWPYPVAPHINPRFAHMFGLPVSSSVQHPGFFGAPQDTEDPPPGSIVYR